MSLRIPIFKCYSASPARSLLTAFLAISFAALSHAAASQTQPAWSFEELAALAQKRAQAAFSAQTKPLPAELANLDYDGYRDIRYNRDAPLWRAGKLPFEANFFHVGREVLPVRINEVVGGVPRRMRYNPADFNFGKNTLNPQNWGDLGHGGLRIFSNVNGPDVKDEAAVFQGASYFRALGAGQRYGLSARGLAVDTTGPKEEFPTFTEFWLERPAADATRVTVYALMESQRMTGAYRFDITPGQQTTTDVRARLFMRAGQPLIRTLGVAPLTSMFLFGENQPQRSDFRPEVHDSDGLMLATGDGEWLWRPLQNPAAPLTTSFSMKSLKGFGLMQRDRSYGNYEDTEARYELRPSAWVTPVGDWGPGRVELFQFPIPDETHDNVAAYWVPEKMPAPGEALELAWRVSWQGKNQQLPPNGYVTQSRRGNGFIPANKDGSLPPNQPTQFTVDFAGPALDALLEDAPVKAIATADANGRIVEALAYKNPANGHWRMTLRLQRTTPTQPVELRAFLQHGGNAVSETWTYLVTP
ncbi:MAG: glucan biosynthesis protein G [Polaromonas sp.]|nr:glucan biosynthesis protein G [Polaromonas sp.]